jgi:lipid A 3-O-deacylase PagL
MLTRMLLAAALVFCPGLASAWDAAQTFHKGALIVSTEGGGGVQDSIDPGFESGLEFWNAGLRVSTLPFNPGGPGPLYGAFEVGLEPYYQHYTTPVHADFGGLGLSLRYHFLSLGRFVPWVEAFGAAGGTDLRIPEIRSDFTFLVHGGVGVSFFVTDHLALYTGYRLQHVSNGNTSQPNRGFESHTGVAGVSWFFR